MKKSTRKKILFATLGLVILGVICIAGGVQYFKYQWFRDTPNTLRIEGDLHSVPFEWGENVYAAHTEVHEAILIPVSVPGISRTLYMQFDTGASNTFLRSGALQALKSRGCEFELFDKDERTCVKTFELNVAGNKVVLESGRVVRRGIRDWDDPDAVITIGTIGTDFIDKRVIAIDFPARRIRMYDQRSQSLQAMGTFIPFDFKGRRILFPATIDGRDHNLLYDSGCSAFGILTSRYYFDQYTDPAADIITYNANRHGDAVPVHHRACELPIQFGATELSSRRVSYVDLYGGVQSVLGGSSGLVGMLGFMGNKVLLDSTLIIDAQANEFLIVPHSISESPR